MCLSLFLASRTIRVCDVRQWLLRIEWLLLAAAMVLLSDKIHCRYVSMAQVNLILIECEEFAMILYKQCQKQQQNATPTVYTVFSAIVSNIRFRSRSYE